MMTEGRIGRDEALYLLGDLELGALMNRAHETRMARHPDGLVTFVYDTNPNYTNICATRCSFCAFHRQLCTDGAFVLTPLQLSERVKLAEERGATTVLLQGGHNPDMGLVDLIEYIRAIRKTCPKMHIHPFSPPEVAFVAKRESMTTLDVLRAFRDEGIDTIPGGGAEILVDRVRRDISPNKCSADVWLHIMEEAHGIGMRTTATMMYGHVETDEDIVEHLFVLRDMQDRTHGFSSFIPWSFKPGKSPLTARVGTAAHPAKYVRIIATARLVLDNFDHVQSSWFSESIGAGTLALLAGADDFGGILVEENVLKQTGYSRKTTLAQVLTMIKRSGFIPARRDSHYNVVENFS